MHDAKPIYDPDHSRVHAVDGFRGLVMLLLISDPDGAFSLPKVAALNPENTLLGHIARQFTHAPWIGLHVWDLIMPAFVLLVGISLTLSFTARRRLGSAESEILASGLLRCFTLIVLGLVLSMPIRSTFVELLPLLILSLGVPWLMFARGLSAFGFTSSSIYSKILHLLVVTGCAWYFITRVGNIGIYESLHLLVQVGLACIIAYPLLARSNAFLIVAVALILAGYWLAFELFPLPTAGLTNTLIAAQGDNVSTSAHFAHWGKNTNAASAFDVWLFNLMPRSEPFALNESGYQTLNFLPMTANVLIGVLAGRAIVGSGDQARLCKRMMLAGTVLTCSGLIAGLWCCPITKIIWTPSFALLSSGLTLIVQGAFIGAFRHDAMRRWAYPLIVIGTNSILLYVLALHFRWRFVTVADLLLQVVAVSPVWLPMFESITVLLMFWTIAFVLYRSRILIRL